MEHAGLPGPAQPGPSPHGRRSGDSRSKLEGDLREAIQAGGLTLHWQPVVHCPTGRLHGFEALARWTHPERGPISPAEFVPLADHTGQVGVLTVLALRKALEQ